MTVAVAVSSVVHLAARRAGRPRARSARRPRPCSALARTVLGGADTPAAVLDHLTGTLGGQARAAGAGDRGRWITRRGRAAAPGRAPKGPCSSRSAGRRLALLRSTARPPRATTSLLAGYTAQAAAALDRERLRIQASQAEALAEGNRIRTALLAAVSHDLRTPLASIKASVAACGRRTSSGRPGRGGRCSPPSSRTPTGSTR